MTIQYANASAADLPTVVDLCMQVEEQHEHYWPLRWQRKPGLRDGYLGWLSRRLNDPRMLIRVARDTSLPPETPPPHTAPAAPLFPAGAPIPSTAPVVGMILVTIDKEIPIYTFSEYAFIQDMAVKESHRRQGIAQHLLADAAAWAKSHHLNQLRLMVATQNPTAAAAFQKAGFQKTYQEMVLPL